MRIVLIYPPPWKIAASGEGPYQDWKPGTPFDGSELRTPYGLLSLAAQAKRAGHQVELLNLYTFPFNRLGLFRL